MIWMLVINIGWSAYGRESSAMMRESLKGDDELPVPEVMTILK